MKYNAIERVVTSTYGLKFQKNRCRKFKICDIDIGPVLVYIMHFNQRYAFKLPAAVPLGDFTRTEIEMDVKDCY